ncbi:transposase, partial [bacterium]|nr:transposase [bacterium]
MLITCLFFGDHYTVPDHSTLWRFRQLLEKQSLMNVLLNAIN